MIERTASSGLWQARGALRRRSVCAGVASALGLTAALLLLCDGLNRLSSWQEISALVGVGVAAAAGLGLLLFAWLRALLRFPNVHELAVLVETQRPELMDALVCCVEIETRPAASRSLMEQALLEKMAGEASGLDCLQLVTPPHLRWSRLAYITAIYACLAVLALHSALFAKAHCRWGELRKSLPAGIVVTPGTVPVPVQTDITVTAEVRRWQKQATIAYRDAQGEHRYPMSRDAGETFSFTFFGVPGPVSYRVETPSLRSPWFTLQPYVPPVLKKAILRLTPPAYTGMPRQELCPPVDARAAAGSEFELEAQTEAAVAAEFVIGGTPVQMPPAGAGRHVYRQVLTKNVEGFIRLRNAEGRTAEGPQFRVEAIPDQPPVVEVLPPAEDTEVTPGSQVEIAARAVDDYGLSEITLSCAVAGGKREVRTLFPLPAPTPAAALPPGKVKATRDHVAGISLDLAAMGAGDGAVVSWFFSAADNCEPKHQRARSQLYFITVRNVPQPKEGKGQGGEKKEMDLGGLIAELKRLIRLSYDVLAMEPEAQVAARPELLSGLRDHRLELQKKTREIEAATGGSAEDIVKLLDAANDELEAAENLVRRALVDEALPAEERGLARLLQAENELIKNAVTAMAEAGKRGSKPPPKEGKEGKPSEDSASKPRPSQGPDLAKLKEWVEKLRDLSRRQGDLNDQLGRMSDTNADKRLTTEAATRERTMEKDARALAADLGQVPPAGRAAAETAAAAASMASGARGLEANQPGDGHREGVRAQNMLQAAVQSLESLYRKAVAESIEKTAQAARDLANTERREAGANRDLAARKDKVPDAEGETRRQQQTDAQQQAQALAGDVRKLGEAVSEQFPDVAAALNEAQAQAQEKNLDGTMSKAANALLYKRFDKAGSLQEDAAGTLQQLGAKLSSAAQKLPAMSRDELREALNKIQEARLAAQQEAKNPSPQAGMQGLQNIRQQMAGELDRLATGLGDQEMKGLSDALGKGQSGDSPQSGAQRVEEVLGAAAQLIEQRLMSLDRRQRLSLQKRSSTMPDQYRRLIENYFKSLSAEEEVP